MRWAGLAKQRLDQTTRKYRQPGNPCSSEKSPSYVTHYKHSSPFPPQGSRPGASPGLTFGGGAPIHISQ